MNSPASTGFPCSLHSPFFHNDSLSETVPCWHVPLFATSGSQTLSEPCPFLSQCYLRYSISVISTVFPCKIGSSHLGINYLLEMPELHQPFEPLCPPCPSLQSSHNHLFPMWLHLWCNLYPTGVCESSLSPSFTENTT